MLAFNFNTICSGCHPIYHIAANRLTFDLPYAGRRGGGELPCGRAGRRAPSRRLLELVATRTLRSRGFVRPSASLFTTGVEALAHLLLSLLPARAAASASIPSVSEPERPRVEA